ncbi:hypothetical protein PNEG_00289 [Pneumocystis murina B123]|uniref:Uncharacterized protein n=1 Tax=Pneumocystis murina (strain B123) TaxID=1069680 RepID=M7NRC1_PNEMU|nr:hypothetical protein PNEG_00289 [Pneumocystis murina B123]EMR11258.1 hypothetical protein PNEG_00289 [Pneumocystis murina B123]
MLPLFFFSRFSKNYKHYKKKLSQDKYSENSSSNYKKNIFESDQWLRSLRSLSVYSKNWRSSILKFKKRSFSFSSRSYLYSPEPSEQNNKDFFVDDIFRTNTATSFISGLSTNTYCSSRTYKIDGFKIFKSRPSVYLKGSIISTERPFPIEAELRRNSQDSYISSLADEMNTAEIRILLERDQRRRKRNKTSRKSQSMGFERVPDLTANTLLNRKISDDVVLNQLPMEHQHFNLISESRRNPIELSSKFNNNMPSVQNSNHSQNYHHKNINRNSTFNFISNNYNNEQKNKETALFSGKNTSLETINELDEQKDHSLVVNQDMIVYLDNNNNQETQFDSTHQDLSLFNDSIQNKFQNKKDHVFHPLFSSQSHVSQQTAHPVELSRHSQILEKNSIREGFAQTTDINLKTDNMGNCSLPTVFDSPFTTISSQESDESSLQTLTSKNLSHILNNYESSKNVYSYITDNFSELFALYNEVDFTPANTFLD